MTPDERIEQFRNMARANPEDELAHFALGSALLDADRHAEAVGALKYVTRLNEHHGKAWQLLGEAYAGTGDDQTAVETWQRGYALARGKGLLAPANAMKQLLEAQGAEVPEASMGEAIEPVAPEDDREPEEGEVRDLRTGRIGPKMQFDPFGDEIGAFIQANIHQESWQAWMEMSVKVINELRLDLAEPAAQQAYDQHMRDFLRLPESLFEGKEYD